MKIRSKTLLILASVVALSVVLNFTVLQSVVYPTFVELENDEAERNISRASDALVNELDSIAILNADWSNWDDTYQYAVDKNAEYADSNLYQGAVESIGMNVLYIYDESGDIAWGAVHDLETSEKLSKEGFELENLESTHFLLSHPEPGAPETGIMLTIHGPMLYSSSAILDSNFEGPSHGTFVMGRFLTPPLLQQMVERTHVLFDANLIEDGRTTVDVAEALEALSGAGQDSPASGYNVHLHVTDVDVHSYALVNNSIGEPILVLRASTPRDISAAGWNTLEITLIGLVAAGTVVLIVLGLLLGRTVVGPLTSLTAQILSIRRSGDLTRSVSSDRSDEIGVLTNEFGSMLKTTSEAQRMLSEHAFQTGMAEMASGLLHNLRNQVQPLVMRTYRLQQLCAQPAGDDIEKAISELSQGVDSAERREKLGQFVRLWKDNVIARQGDAEVQLEKMTKGLSSLDAMLDDQDALTRGERKIEATDAADILRDAAQSVAELENENVAMKIGPELESLKPVQVERFLLKQSLVSIFRNASEALEGIEKPEVVVSVSEGTHANVSAATITIADNGIGIDHDQLQKVFDRGYSTKEGNRRGLGMHWCANALRSMGGSIEIESEGKGMGARVHIHLPTQEQSTKAA